MAKKKDDSTPGMYVRRKKQIVPGTKENIRAGVGALKAELNIDVQLSRAEQIALRLVVAAGGKAEWPFEVPETADDRAKRAELVLRRIVYTRRALETDSTRDAAINAFYVGQMMEQVNVLRFDPLVKTGRKVHGGGDKGGSRQTTSKELRRRRVLERVAEVREEHREWSLTSVRKAVAKEFGIHPRTILRYLEKK